MSGSGDPPETGRAYANWCGRDACPACQGYDKGPATAPDCPYLGEPLPAEGDE